MKKTKYIYLVIAVFGTLLAVFWQQENLEYLNGKYPASNGMITTADELSYFQPPENWLSEGVWKDGSTGSSSYVQRPPGYGLLFLLCKFLFHSNPYLLIKLFQITAYFFSILLVGKTIEELVQNRRWAIGGAVIYAVFPLYSGFMYYTLTEGITPYLLLLEFYTFLNVYRNKRGMSGFVVATMFLLLVRPQLLIFPILFSLSILWTNRQHWVAVSIAFVPFALWQLRSFSYSNEITLHPIYSYSNLSLYRPPHKSLTNLFRVWEYRGDRFHETVGILSTDTTEINLNFALSNVPIEYRSEVKGVLREYQLICQDVRKMVNDSSAISPLESERTFVLKTDRITRDLALKNMVGAFVETPMKSAYVLLNKSHLNLKIFQEKWRGNWWMETLRWASIILISLSFLSVSLLVFFSSTKELLLVSIGVLITLLYLVFVQRLNEERYLTPILPIALIALVTSTNQFYSKWRHKKRANLSNGPSKY